MWCPDPRQVEGRYHEPISTSTLFQGYRLASYSNATHLRIIDVVLCGTGTAWADSMRTLARACPRIEYLYIECAAGATPDAFIEFVRSASKTLRCAVINHFYAGDTTEVDSEHIVRAFTRWNTAHERELRHLGFYP